MTSSDSPTCHSPVPATAGWLQDEPSFRQTAGAVGAEFPGAELVQDRFGDDRARRIAGAKKKHVEWLIGHGLSLNVMICATVAGTFCQTKRDA